MTKFCIFFHFANILFLVTFSYAWIIQLKKISGKFLQVIWYTYELKVMTLPVDFTIENAILIVLSSYYL